MYLQEDEVAEIKWIKVKDLEDWVKEKPQDFTPNFPTGSLVNIRESFEKLNFENNEFKIKIK